MRQGDYAQLVFSKKGNLVAIATGSDACAEHECGSKPLMSLLCNQYDNERTVVAALRRGDTLLTRCKALLTGKPAVQYPDILEAKRIVKTPAALRLVERDGEVPEAILYCCRSEVGFDNRELQFREHRAGWGDPDVAGAWCSDAFAIRVRGKKYVKALRAFFAAMEAHKVAFGGTFFRRDNVELSGVVLVNTEFLSDEDRARVEKAQRDYESNLRLKARDDTGELFREMHEACAGAKEYGPGYIWVRWKDAEESGVVYCLNPGYGVKADYYGPYTREQLLDWAAAKYSYHLSSAKQAA